MGVFHSLNRIHCDPKVALLAIARFPEVDWEATGVERFPFHYSQSKFVFIPPVAGVTRRRADRTEVTEGDHDEIRPVYREKFGYRGMSYEFAERAWHL